MLYDSFVDYGQKGYDKNIMFLSLVFTYYLKIRQSKVSYILEHFLSTSCMGSTVIAGESRIIVSKSAFHEIVVIVN